MLGFYQATALGPLDDISFELLLENEGHFPIEWALFNLYPTEADAPGNQHLIIDGTPFDVINNTGGVATLVPIQSDLADTIWAYRFAGFDPGESFQFSWDADIVGDSTYAAMVREQVGMQISFVGPGVAGGGFLAIEGDELVMRIISTPFPIPEPSTLLLLGSGLVAWRLRRSPARCPHS
jgi:hypothetical protein